MISKIKAVLFDFGGVLAEEGFRNGLNTLAAEQELAVEDMAKEGMRAVYDSGFVLGRGTEKDFWALLRERTGLEGNDAVLTQRILKGFVLRPWMMALVERLHTEGYVTGILSDQTDWLDRLDSRYQFYAAFDRIYNSYYLGKGKQDPSLFRDVADDLGFPLEAILFVDDDANNIARAHAAGLCTIQYIDKQRFIADLDTILSKED